MEEFKIDSVLNIKPISDQTPEKKEYLKKKKKKQQEEKPQQTPQKPQDGHIDIYV